MVAKGSAWPGPRLTLLAGAGAALLLTGCGTAPQAGAAAVVGDERVPTDELLAEAAEVEEGAETGDEAGIAGDLVLHRVELALIEHIAADRGVTASQGEVDAQLDEAMMQQAMAGQEMPQSLVEDEARVQVLVEDLAQQGDPDELDQLQDEALDEAAEQLTAEAEQLQGLSGDELEEFVDEQLQEQEQLVEDQLPQLYLNELVPRYLEETDIEVSPRYGTFDPDTMQFAPGESELSAQEPEEQPMPEGFPPMPEMEQ